MHYTAPMLPPILVTGTPRSGKSVVARLITKEPSYQWIHEPLMIWDMDMGTREDDRRSAKEVTTSLRERIMNSCTELLEEQQNIYVDDLSYHAMRIPFIHALMPEAKIIHVVRDPEHAIPEMLYGWTYRDSVGKAFARRRRSIRLQGLPRMVFRFVRNYIDSRLKGRRATWGPRVPNLAAFVESHPPAEVAAFQWKSMVEIAMDDLAIIPSTNWIQVSYDELLVDPRGQALRIGEFCSVSNPDGFADKATKFIDPEFPFEKKVYPTDAEWATIRPMIEQVRNRMNQSA
tara:strand:+ start:382 stop:1245 length:864 start_codon:yes stop_codon:yes gene_type:complete